MAPRPDFYQMCAYGSAGKRRYNEIVLYPISGLPQRTFQQGDMRLHVRHFDPRSIYDMESGAVNEKGVLSELSRGLATV